MGIKESNMGDFFWDFMKGIGPLFIVALFVGACIFMMTMSTLGGCASGIAIPLLVLGLGLGLGLFH